MTKRVTIIFDDDNDAFATDPEEQYDKICGVVRYIMQHGGSLNIHDTNGNKIGFVAAD